jgi:hypothetical protein
VVNPTRRDERTLRYGVALRLPQERISTADRLLMPQGLAAPDGSLHSLVPSLVDQGLQSQASAEVYFQRPANRADGRREYASLFNPYWQARLVEVSAAERLLIAPARGLSTDPYAVLP